MKSESEEIEMEDCGIYPNHVYLFFQIAFFSLWMIGVFLQMYEIAAACIILMAINLFGYVILAVLESKE
jgi:hypothetical protein